MPKQLCFQLVKKRNRRADTAVLMFPGLIPTYSDLMGEANLFSRFGDVFEFRYPDKDIDIYDLYQTATSAVKRLGYKQVILLGMSFGGTVAYLLARYWRKHGVGVRLVAFVAMSTPFEPTNLTLRSQVELGFGATLDRHTRRMMVTIVQSLKFVWQFSFGYAKFYAKDSSLKQTINAIRMGYILRQDWIVKYRFAQVPALLLNTRDKVSDPFVLRKNETDFMEIFPYGKIMRVLSRHADTRGIKPAVSRQIARFMREALEETKRV